LHVASKLGQPVTLIHGDDEFGSSDLVGNDAGYRKNRLVDNYIHSVLKEEETMRTLWVDNRLTTACRYGHTLVYDEFTRSRPEANNVLLSVLGEGLLSLPKLRYAGEGYLKVDPKFRAIFTSNPEEYAGIHKSQDALMDRLIPIHVDHYDRDTEVAITAARSGASTEDAGRVVDLVRRFRASGMQGHRPSIRAAITIARVVTLQGASFDPVDRVFQRTCGDVLGLDCAGARSPEQPRSAELIEEQFGRTCDAVEAALHSSD
jgi:nitric oxide reductase NorQ protein